MGFFTKKKSLELIYSIEYVSMLPYEDLLVSFSQILHHLKYFPCSFVYLVITSFNNFKKKKTCTTISHALLKAITEEQAPALSDHGREHR